MTVWNLRLDLHAHPHARNTPGHTGQPTPPPANRTSTTTGSASTVTTGASAHPARPSRVSSRTNRREGRRPVIGTLTTPTTTIRTRKPPKPHIRTRNDANASNNRNPDDAQQPLATGTTLALTMAMAGRAAFCFDLEGAGAATLRQRADAA